MAQIIKFVFKHDGVLKFKVEDVHYFEAREAYVDFALNSHKEIIELEEFQYARPGSYRIPLFNLKFSGLQFN